MTLPIPPAGYSPGRFIQDSLDDCLMDRNDLSLQLGMSVHEVDRLIADGISITPKIAVLLGLVFNTSPRIWQNLHTGFERGKR